MTEQSTEKNTILYIVVGFFLILLVLGGAIVLLGSGQPDAEVSIPGNVQIIDGDSAEYHVNDFDELFFTDHNGSEVRLSDFKGKIIVANVWATWCPFCINEMPDFARLKQEFGDDIVVLTIDRRESQEEQQLYLSDLTDSSGVDLGSSLITLNDPTDSFYRAIGGFSMPETIFFDSKGRGFEHIRGPMTLEDMKEMVANLM